MASETQKIGVGVGVIDLPIFSIARDACEKEPLDDILRAANPDVQITIKDLRSTGGDYSLVGHEKEIAIERKSIKDLLGTLYSHTILADGTKQQNLGRFAWELQKLGAMHLSYVAVEGTRDDLAKRIERRARECERFGKKQRITFNSTLGLISSLKAEFGVCFCFFRDRIEMAKTIYADLFHYWRMVNGLSRSKIGGYKPSPINELSTKKSTTKVPPTENQGEKKNAFDP